MVVVHWRVEKFSGLPGPEMGHSLWTIRNNSIGNRRRLVGSHAEKVGSTVGIGVPLD